MCHTPMGFEGEEEENLKQMLEIGNGADGNGNKSLTVLEFKEWYRLS